MINTIRFSGEELSPTKIVCIDRNYVAHVEELDNEIPIDPVIFIKPNSLISKSVFTDENESVHFEGEVCFVINAGRLAGVGFGLDLTKRAVQTELKTL
tara:strand:- start:186 stop:479 length:294 start_codon:yes stop_codon:yes gene_type:complete